MAELAVASLVASTASGIIDTAETSKGLKRAARVDDENARLSVLSGEQEALQTLREERRATGEMIAMQGMSGTLVGTGSNARAVAQNAYQRELEILNIRTRAGREADNYKQSAKDKRRQAKQAVVSGLFGTVANALGGAAQIRQAGKIRAQNERRRDNDPRKFDKKTPRWWEKT